jgi:BTB/POZ domain-containing protein KCTD9
LPEWVAIADQHWTHRAVQVIAAYGILFTIVFYFLSSGDRKKNAEYQAWQVINTAQGTGGSGGRIHAVEDLIESGASLSGVSLEGAWLRGANLSKGIMDEANLRDANLTLVNLKGALLTRANLLRARLSGAKLIQARVTNAYFDSSSARGLDASNLQGDSVYFRSADLRGAKFVRAQLRDSDFRLARLDDADLSFAQLDGARLQRAMLRGANLTNATFRRAVLTGADLSLTRLDSADFTGADLSRTSINVTPTWHLIRSLRDANVYGVIAPYAFFAWAIDTMGARCTTPTGEMRSVQQCLPAAVQP